MLWLARKKLSGSHFGLGSHETLQGRERVDALDPLRVVVADVVDVVARRRMLEASQNVRVQPMFAASSSGRCHMPTTLIRYGLVRFANAVASSSTRDIAPPIWWIRTCDIGDAARAKLSTILSIEVG